MPGLGCVPKASEFTFLHITLFWPHFSWESIKHERKKKVIVIIYWTLVYLALFKYFFSMDLFNHKSNQQEINKQMGVKPGIWILHKLVILAVAL